jgi:hypothetical protein
MDGHTADAEVGVIENGWTLEQDLILPGVARARMWSRVLDADYLAAQSTSPSYTYFQAGTLTVPNPSMYASTTSTSIPNGMSREEFVKSFRVILTDASTSYTYSPNPLDKSSLVSVFAFNPDTDGGTLSGWTKIYGLIDRPPDRPIYPGPDDYPTYGGLSYYRWMPDTYDTFVPGPFPVKGTWRGFPFVYIEEKVFTLPSAVTDEFPYTISNPAGQTSTATVTLTIPTPPPLRVRPNYYIQPTLDGE